MGLSMQSHLLLTQSAFKRAEETERESLHLGPWLQHLWATGSPLLQLPGSLAHDELVQAEHLAVESLRSSTKLGDPWSRRRALLAPGWVADARGELRGPREHVNQALTIARLTQLDPLALDAPLGHAYLMREDAPTPALAVFDQMIGHPAATQPTRQRAVLLRTEVQAVAAEDRPAGVHITAGAELLTAREVEVLRLLARGYSNTVIATELVAAVGTVKRHVNSVLRKLDAESRLQASARARNLGLV